MQFENLYIERPSPDVKLIIIPMNKVYFSQNIELTKPKPLQYVLIFERKNEDISRADFIQIYPVDINLKQMPKNAFHDFYYQLTTQIDGVYTFLNFGDVKQIEMYIKNGEREKSKVWHSKNENFLTNDIGCTEWELITAYYHDDKPPTEEKVPLGKTCTECPPGFKCDPVK